MNSPLSKHTFPLTRKLVMTDFVETRENWKNGAWCTTKNNDKKVCYLFCIYAESMISRAWQLGILKKKWKNFSQLTKHHKLKSYTYIEFINHWLFLTTTQAFQLNLLGFRLIQAYLCSYQQTRLHICDLTGKMERIGPAVQTKNYNKNLCNPISDLHTCSWKRENTPWNRPVFIQGH